MSSLINARIRSAHALTISEILAQQFYNESFLQKSQSNIKNSFGGFKLLKIPSELKIIFYVGGACICAMLSPEQSFASGIPPQIPYIMQQQYGQQTNNTQGTQNNPHGSNSSVIQNRRPSFVMEMEKLEMAELEFSIQERVLPTCVGKAEIDSHSEVLVNLALRVMDLQSQVYNRTDYVHQVKQYSCDSTCVSDHTTEFSKLEYMEMRNKYFAKQAQNVLDDQKDALAGSISNLKDNKK